MEKGKITIPIPEGEINIGAPNMFVRESDKTADWYLDWGRYIASFYNQVAFNYDIAAPLTQKNNSGDNNTGQSSSFLPRISDNMVNNFAYLDGQQPNINYRYVQQDSTGRTFTSFMKGRNAGMLMDFVNGDLLGALDSISFDVNSLSKDVISKKNEIFNKIELKQAAKGHLQDMESAGVSFKPYHKDFELDEDVDAEKSDWKDSLEEDGINITDDIFKRENCKFKYSDTFLNQICGGAFVYNYVQNGKVKKEVIPCYSAIWDNRKDNDFGEGMQFWGFVKYSTPAQLISKYPDLLKIENAVQYLNAIAGNQVENMPQFTTYYNGGFSNFAWWNMNNNNNEVAELTLFFIAPKDLQFKKYVNDKGKTKVKKVGNVLKEKYISYTKSQLETIADSEKYQTEQGDYLTMATHKVTIIGNKWPVNYGYNNNEIRDFYNKGNVVPNMSVFLPNMRFGKPRVIADMIKQYQDKIDYYEKKVDDLVGRDNGKVPIVNAAAMGEGGKDALDFVDDMRSKGMLVARSTGEFQKMMANSRAVEVVDLSQNQYILNYLELKRQQKEDMKEIVGLSNIALGQQKTYVGRDVQGVSINRGSNVMKYQIDGFFEFMRRDMQYSMNLQKMLIGTGKDKDGDLVIGTKGVMRMKSLGKRRFEDLMLYIKIQDSVDDAQRNRILAYAQAWSQNPAFGVTPDDILMLEQERSLSDMIRKLKHSMKKHQMDAQQQQQYEKMVGMVEREKEMKHEKEMASMENDREDARHALDKQEGLTKAMINHKTATDVSSANQPQAA